jgi:FixJ family two-component response regulator
MNFPVFSQLAGNFGDGFLFIAADTETICCTRFANRSASHASKNCLATAVIFGLELLAEIKQRFPNLPVMMVTAYGDDNRRRQARELGAFEFITKPVDFDQLRVWLQELSTN